MSKSKALKLHKERVIAFHCKFTKHVFGMMVTLKLIGAVIHFIH